jgi:hypothetical protein
MEMTLNDLIEMLKLMKGFDAKTQLIVYPKNFDGKGNICDGTYADAMNSSLFVMYGTRNVSFWERIGGGIRICIEGDRYKPNQKFYFHVSIGSCEGYAAGRVKLTMDQALAVAYATNSENWLDYEDDSYDTPVFGIDIKSAEPVED